MVDDGAFLPTDNVTLTDALRSPVTRTLLDYWRGKCAGRAMPAWSDIALMDLYKIASKIVVRDVVDGGREFRCRFSGTGMSAVLGVDGTGKTLAEAFSPKAAEMIRRRYLPALTSNGPVRAVGYVRAVEKNLPTVYEAVYLPLAGADGGVGYVIAAYDFEYEPAPGEAPSPVRFT